MSMIHKFHIIKRAYLRLFIGAVLLLGSRILFFMNGRFSEEFTGWVKITVQWSIDQEKAETDITAYLVSQWYLQNRVLLEVSDIGTNISIVTDMQSDEKVANLSKEIQQLLISEKFISGTDKIIQQSITWPSVGWYMQSTAIKALIIGLILMAVYMIFAFAAIRKYISPSVLAWVTIATMIFDISIPAGAYGFLMMVNSSITIDTIFIIAILTNMWYSINDTIIIFDRIRENMQTKWYHKGAVFGKIFEDSLWQTMRRSFGTVFSTLLVIIAMYILWTWAIKYFAFTMWIGVIAGSFSSIFIAAPLAYLIMGKYKEEKKAMLESKE